jgi:hypothetical protein
MARPKLHSFQEDLKKRPAKGSNAPPVSIRAKDLDENYEKVTLISSPDIPKPYDVEYTKEGTRLKNMRPLPKDAQAQRILCCINGEARGFWFLTWNVEPVLPRG